jgi:hypothetical protein
MRTTLVDRQAGPRVLTPSDWGILFETDEIELDRVVGSYAVVRWTDDWGTRWEHKREVVRRISDDEHWAL